MHPLSATDAINPAIARTRRLLTIRRSWLTALKLGFLSLLAEVGANFNSNFGNGFNGHSPHPHLPAAFTAILVGAMVAIAVVFFLVSLVLFYIGSRLQFVLFDLVLRQDTVVAPSWKMFGHVTWRWVGLRLLLTVCALLPFAPILIPAFIRLSHLSAAPQPQNGVAFGAFFAAILGVMGTLMLCFMVLYVVLIVARDFGLPAIVFENANLKTTFRRAIEPFRMDPGQTLLYLLLRMVLAVAGAVAAEIGVFLVGLISVIPLALVGGIFYFLVHSHGIAGKILAVIVVAFLGFVWIVWFAVLLCLSLGSLQLFFISYSMYFLGGRYQPLGVALVAQEPQLAYPAGYIPPLQPGTPPPPPPAAMPSPS